MLPETVVLAASSGRSLARYLLQLFWMNSSFLDVKKPRILKALKTVYSPHRSPCQKPSIHPIDHTDVIESLWSGQGLIRERWCCARGWWNIPVLTGLIAGDTWNLVLLLSLSICIYPWRRQSPTGESPSRNLTIISAKTEREIKNEKQCRENATNFHIQPLVKEKMLFSEQSNRPHLSPSVKLLVSDVRSTYI